MTEIILGDPGRRSAGVRRMVKANLRIDMTPMVDLGFLLIAFFIFTTEVSKPVVSNLYMPHEGEPITVADSKSLTILLAGNDKLYCYFGNIQDAINSKGIFETSYNEILGLGNIIRQKQSSLEKRNVEKDQLVVLIKPGNQCSYRNVVNVMDEMIINGVTRYVLVDPVKDEQKFLVE